MRTRQQQWAEMTYAKVSSSKGEGEADYKRFCQSFPALIQGSGLCQALSFAMAKGKDRHYISRYLEHLADILGITKEQLVKQSQQADVMEYQRLSRDALAVAAWLKRYAEALLKESKRNDTGLQK